MKHFRLAVKNAIYVWFDIKIVTILGVHPSCDNISL